MTPEPTLNAHNKEEFPPTDIGRNGHDVQSAVKGIKLSFRKLILLNYSIVLVLVALFPIGLNATLTFIPFSWVLFVHLNFVKSNSVRELLILDINMTVASTLSVIISSGLYFWLVWYDGLGLLLAFYETLVVFLISLIFTIIGVILKSRQNKKAPKRRFFYDMFFPPN